MQPSPRPSRLRPALAAVALAAIAGYAFDASAVPVFARKYETSCQTCHVAFPKLTPFGEAFRRNGYRFPAGEEEDATKDEPLRLGQEAHKKVFPRAVWPGEIPSAVPLAVQLGSQAAYVPHGDAKLSFADLGGSLRLNFAATLGERFAVWAGAMLAAAPLPDGGEEVRAELERVFAVVTPLDSPALALRIGRFEAGASGITAHRLLGPSPWITSSRLKDNGFTLDPAQLGVEATGVLGGRFTYSAGVVEGAGNLVNTAKDFYGRAAYKLGGMRLDGVGGAAESDPWRETSLTIGGFGYLGRATIGDPALATQVDRTWLAGADASLIWRDANLIVGYARGHNQRPELAHPTEEVSSWHLFSQLDYVVYPWLVPTLRFERRSLGGHPENRVVGGVFLLLRANIRVQALAVAEVDDGKPDLEQVLGGISLAF